MNEELIGMDTVLAIFKENLEQIVSLWDGKDSGILEDRAHCAKEIQEKCDEIRNLIAELV